MTSQELSDLLKTHQNNKVPEVSHSHLHDRLLPPQNQGLIRAIADQRMKGLFYY